MGLHTTQRGGKYQHTLCHSISSAANVCPQGETIGGGRHFECLSWLISNLYPDWICGGQHICGYIMQGAERCRDPIINTMASWIREVNNEQPLIWLVVLGDDSKPADVTSLHSFWSGTGPRGDYVHMTAVIILV